MSRLTRDGTAEPVSRDQILRHARGQGNIIFPVQLTTSRIGNLTWLIHTLLYVMTIPTYCTYIHKYSDHILYFWSRIKKTDLVHFSIPVSFSFHLNFRSKAYIGVVGNNCGQISLLWAVHRKVQSLFNGSPRLVCFRPGVTGTIYLYLAGGTRESLSPQELFLGTAFVTVFRQQAAVWMGGG